MNPQRLDSLIDAALDDALTAADAATLSEELRRSSSARARYWQAASLHGLLESALQSEWLTAAAPAEAAPIPARSGASTWRMAAGIVLGALCASAAWAGVAFFARAPAPMPLALADAGFEHAAALPVGEVPEEAGQWRGDLTAMVGRTGRVQPHEGAAMLRFLSVGPQPNEVDMKPICSDIWQVAPLPTGLSRTVKVRAWFNAETGPKQARFHLYAMVGAGEVQTAPALWAKRFGESSDVLTSGRTMKFVDADPATWEAAEVVLQVPAEARLLLIGLAAYRLPQTPPAQWLPAQFADAVSVTLEEEARP